MTERRQMGNQSNDPRHPVAAAIQDLVTGKARAIERTGVAEISYQIEIEAPDGLKLRDKGVIRRDPQEMPVLPPSPATDRIVEAVIERLKGGGDIGTKGR